MVIIIKGIYGNIKSEYISMYWSMCPIFVPRECRSARKLNRLQARKRWFFQRFFGPDPFLWVSRQNIRRKIERWRENKHLVLWLDPCTQREARELISGCYLATRVRLLSFNRTQSRVVIGLLTGRNTLRRLLYIMGWVIIPPVGNVGLRRKPQSTFCASVRLWLHSDIHICVPSF
jgi:hypothetical protein